MSITYHVAVVGLGKVGGRLATELCRFFHAMKDPHVACLSLFDGAIVDEADVMDGQEYIREDIGWHKSAVLAGVYSETFPNVKVKGYPALQDQVALRDGLELTNVYDASKRVALIFDMSNGGRGVSEILRKFFYSYPNSIVISVANSALQVGIRLVGSTIKKPHRSTQKKAYSVAEAVRICRLCLAKTAMLMTDGTLTDDPLVLEKDGFGIKTAAQATRAEKTKRIRFAGKGEKLLCVTVGCGGTGGNFIKEFVHTQMRTNKNLSLLIIDGDRVEEKNLSRQPFSEIDILQNKAACLARDLIAEEAALKNRLFYHPYYLDAIEDLASAVRQTGYDGKLVLVGAVDNHRARQVMEAFYQSMKDCVYIDAANEWSNGEIVVSVKCHNKERSPLRSFYYPDVLTDRSPSASEQSCSVINESAPQHFCTNLASAHGILDAIEMIVATGSVRGGIFYFDVFKEYARFQEVLL